MRITLLIFVLLSVASAAMSQDKVLGPKYYQAYDNQVTGRVYFSRKFTSVALNNRSYSLLYRPNTTVNFGVGATYKWATLNLAYGFGFLNPDRGRGKTRYLDLQFHSYGRKVSVDVLGQFYNGFYLTPKGIAGPDNEYYRRPDLKVRAVGATVQYIFNHNQFSYRAAFLQNEWQQKSAGTWLVGFELYTGNIHADSTIIPTVIDRETAADNIRRFQFLELGPNVGYAYTYVYKQHFFITGAGSVSLDLGVNNVTDKDGRNKSVGFNPNTIFRVSAGYNSDKWAFNILYVSNAMRLTPHENITATTLRTGNVRLLITHRFRPSRKVREYLKAIDRLDEGMKP